MTLTQLIVASAWKGSILLVCGFAGAAALRRASAAVRHGLWTAVLAALMALPACLWLASRWNFEVAAPAAPQWMPAIPASAAVVTGNSAMHHDLPWLLLLWLAGSAAAAGWFLTGTARILWMARGATPADRANGTARPVMESERVPVPMAWGLWRPVVLLPSAARDWPPERLRSALLHETTHIRRGDLWIQLLSQAACTAYWFHPLVWLAGRQLRREREGACDDAVLRAGVAAPEYAGHLMDLARALAGRHVQAPAMAEGSDLESRVRALLDGRRDRRPLGWRAIAAIAGGSLAVLLPLGALRAEGRRSAPVAEPAAPRLVTPPPAPAASVGPPARPAARRLVAQAPAPRTPEPDRSVNTSGPAITGPISGVVMDPTGAVVPRCQVIARSLDGSSTVEVLVTDAAGRYKFDTLPPGRYVLQFEVPGFKPALVMAQDNAPQYIWLTVGSMAESVVVGAPKPAVTGVAPAPGPQRIRVGGNVQPSRLISRTEPVYPPELQQLGIEGTVMLRAIISKTGDPANLQVISTGIDPRLARAALDSVSQWRYQPTLLNGQPVETETTITVDFKLEP